MKYIIHNNTINNARKNTLLTFFIFFTCISCATYLKKNIDKVQNDDILRENTDNVPQQENEETPPTQQETPGQYFFSIMDNTRNKLYTGIQNVQDYVLPAINTTYTTARTYLPHTIRWIAQMSFFSLITNLTIRTWSTWFPSTTIPPLVITNYYHTSVTMNLYNNMTEYYFNEKLPNTLCAVLCPCDGDNVNMPTNISMLT